TAGLARSLVSGYSRSPTPPASTMTSVSSTFADIAGSTPPQYDARRRAVAANDPQRQADHVVDARLDVAQIQAFDDDRAGAEQQVVRGRARRVEFLDRQVVDAHHLDALVDQVPRARLGDADEARLEGRRSPQPRVARLEEHADVLGEVEPGQV